MLAGMFAACSTGNVYGQAKAEEEEEAIVLSPFVISSTSDVGYQATSSLAGTRLNTKLRDLGSSISVVNQEFIKDSATTSIGDLLVYTTGTEVGGAFGNFTNSSLDRGRSSQQDNRGAPEQNTRVRGLVSAEVSRDFFITDFGFDSYNVERVDISRGPNSVLFGVGSPGGVINYTTKRPVLHRDAYLVSSRVGERGTHRQIVDLNKVIVKGRLGVRGVFLYEDENYKQRPAYEKDERFFGTIEGVLWEGKRSGLLGTGKLRFDYEGARVQSTPPNVIAPTDNIVNWYMVPNTASISAQTGQAAPARYSDGSFVSQAMHDRFGANAPFRGSFAQLLPWFITVGQIYNDPTSGNAPRVGFTDPASAGLQAIEGRVVGRFDWLTQSNLVEETWTTGFTARSFQNTDIYDFKNNLITGRLESRADKFNSSTVAFEQLLMDGKAGFELSYNAQALSRRTDFPFSNYRSADVWIDNNLWHGNGQPNPNAGRPFMVSRDWGNHGLSKIDRSTKRLTAFYDLDLKKLVSTRAGSWLGRHIFSGIVEQADREQLSRQYAMAVSSNDINMQVALDGLKGNIRRQLHAGFYVGPDLRGTPNYENVRLTGYLDVPRPKNGDTFTTFIRDPANNTIRNVTAFADEFLNTGTASKRVIDTKAVTLQSYFLNDHLVTLVGNRQDRVRDTLNVGGPRLADGSFDPAALRLAGQPSLDAKGDTNTVSLVGHFPQKLLFTLPYDSDLSVFWAKSENFQPTGFRQDVFLRSIPPPNGVTTEQGFMLSFLENRFSMRLNWYETKNNNISLDTNLATASTSAIMGWVNRLAEAQRIGVPFGFTVGGQPTGLANHYSSYDQVIQVLFNMVPEPMKSARNLRIDGVGVGLQSVSSDPVPGLASTSSFVAKGIEMEFVANPTGNWTMAVNVAKQATVQEGSGLELQDYYSRIQQSLVSANLWNTDIIDEPNVQGTITYRQRFTRDFLNPLAAINARDGAVSQEQRKWRVNLMTAYQFKNSAWLKGVDVGGALRWQDKAAVGYPILLVTSAGQTLQTPDLANPHYAPASWNGDVFIRYKREIVRGINWTVQANFRNLLGDQKLSPEVINPNGEWAVVRIPVERAFFITNTFEF